ncbi:glycosyltransferase [Pseudomonas pseudonitroreducens]|uniref:glycosyltransferase n=1 Tax=Pseudomonas pseudonitroreducens TaxID=2892326 RepID=UPI001F23E5E2|nr:glycosyltransferase [Pseudomonas pseudonitroreducens]
MGKNIVISAINIIDGGALTILKDAISAFEYQSSNGHNITFLVSSPDVHQDIPTKNIYFEYFPSSKKRWINRLFFEYIFFYFYSIRKKVDIWLSLHDTTPNVCSPKRYAYCHNPSIFLNFPIKDVGLDFKQFLFSKFYKYLYKINIKKNTNIIVQQAWIADEFSKIFKLSNMIVATPQAFSQRTVPEKFNTREYNPPKQTEDYKLFYPAFPRYFKNHSVIFEASRQLIGTTFILTIDGSENNFAKKLISRNVSKNIKLIGIQSREAVFKNYRNCDALVFPSLLETWGLPLSEFMQFSKPIIAADLPYAHETLGNYSRIYWFSPTSPDSLISAINRARSGQAPDSPKFTTSRHELLQSWEDLADYISTEK